MKSKCTFILKSGLALMLALVLLFGTVTASVAATVNSRSAAVDSESDSAGTPFRDADGVTKIVIYYDDTYSKLSELKGFEDLYLVIIGDTYYRGYKMADLQDDNMFVTTVNESYDDAKMIFVMAVDKDWTGDSSEAVGAPFEKNVKKLPGVIGYTDTYKDDFAFETTDAAKGHGYLLNTTEKKSKTLSVNDIGICPQEFVLPEADAEEEPAASVDSDYFLSVIDSLKKDALDLPELVDEEPAEVVEDAAPAESFEEDTVKSGKDSDLADTGASAGTWKVTFKANMGSGDYNTGTTYYTMTRSTKNTNRYYYVATLTANTTYGFFLQYNSSNFWKANATISLGGHTELFDYGSNNYGNSSHRVTFTSGSATSYVFMFDISTNEVFVNSVTPGVEFTYDIASGHDSNYDLNNKVSMTYSSYLYTCDIASMSAAKYYLFCKVGSNYYRGTSTLTTSAPASLWDYGTSNYGGSGDKVNFTPSSAGKYRFTYDVRDATVSVVKVYDITYNKNNGTGTAPSNQTVTAGSSVTIGTNSLNRTGYSANGWYTTAIGTGGTAYANGASYTANANLTLYARWTEKTSTFTVQAGSNGSITKSGTTSGVASYVTVSAVTPSSGYSFVGWQITGADASHVRIKNSSGTEVFNGSKWSSDANQYLTSIRVYSDGSSASMTATVTAVFAKVHYMSLYNTTVFDRGHWIVQGSPPQEVKVTHASGAVTTYTYSAGNKAQRGEDQTTSGSPGTSNIKTSGTYYEGNKLTIYEGDTIELKYSALASSDIISGIFYNNAIRYTTELEDDNLFLKRVYNAAGYGEYGENGEGYTNGASVSNPPDDDWEYKYDANYSDDTDGHALYANPKYYYDETRETIEENEEYYDAEVNQDTHVVSWTAGDRDYLNVDIELSNKREIHFSDTVNTVINEIHTDNYYAIGEDVSPGIAANTSLSIKAAGNADQTNTITKENIKFYYCNNMGEYINPETGRKVSKEKRVELTDDDATLTVEGSAASIANSGATASTNFYYIDGPMPDCDVLVDLDLVTTYSLTLRSKIQSDTIGSKTALGQVASLTMGTTTYSKNNSCTTSTNCVTGTYPAGTGVTLKAVPDDGYMFVGWFWGTASAPDLNSAPLSSNATFSYKPTKSGYIWAVGTRDLYIAGSKYLFGDANNWENANHKMKFDATLGTKGKYYWEIDETIFAAASRSYTCVDNNTTTTSNINGYFSGGGTYRYWNGNNDSYHGNAYFQFIDVATGQSDDTKKTVWGNVVSFENEASNVRYGKVLQRDTDSTDGNGAAGTTRSKKGQGFIAFNETTYSGYSTPIRIYYDPANTGTFTVEPTPIYPHVYLSNGYKGLDVSNTGTPSAVTIKVNSGTARSNNTTSTTYTDMVFNGNGWNPNYEGHVSDITVKARNATLTLTKTTSSNNYKVSNFLVYNITKDTVKAYPATATGTTNQYSCNTIKTSDDDSLYIIPILEYIGSNKKMTVVVDSSKLDYDEWGDIVACYAWNGSGDNYGPYPGQPMVPSDDGTSWKATFECASLTGITFSNYVNDAANTTFLDTSGTMGTVGNHASGTASGGRINVYNHIDSDDDTYDRTNFKAQTYDYREPIAYFNNLPNGVDNSVLTFALKSGESKLISWNHSELISNNILNLPSGWTPLEWEYLTDSTGTKYADLNGFALSEKPTASFYIAAKAMVVYSDNSMTKVFGVGKSNQTTSGITYNDYKGKVTGEIDMNFAVQWYVYDASGKYITNVLSAGFADKSATNNDMTVVAQRLLDLGYAVEGRSVKISYDKPRYCYQNSNGPNSGENFDVYRFTGQWYQDNEYKTAKVYAKVGIMTDNGAEVADASSATYGSATVTVNNSLCTVTGYSGTDEEDGVDYGYTTVIDGDKGAITLTADTTNFIGWHHYNTDKELVLDTKEAAFRPTYSKDVTYIAMYEAKVNYSYKYVGRENGTKYYNVGSNTHLTDTEIAAGNKVATDDTHTSEAGTKSPGSAGIGIFKKNVSFTTPVTSGMLTNPNEYQLIVNNCSVTPATYRITAKYRNANGALQDYVTPLTQYNQSVDLTVLNGGTPLTSYYNSSSHKFIGWYEYKDGGTLGQLLSTQHNYGMVMVKQQTIVAVYEGDGYGISAPTDDDWHAYVDDNEVNYEMTSATAGILYNDAIIRVRKNDSNEPDLNPNGKVGLLIVDDGGTNQTINTSKLAAYAAALNTNGKTGNVPVTGGTALVTNFFTSASNVNNFGRADFAAKYSFGSVSGHKYQIYAYYYDGSTYHFNTTATSGTYN